MKDNKNTGVMPTKIDVESISERKKRGGITLDMAYPEIAKQLHPRKNGTFTANNLPIGCGKKVWWICDQGHEWQVAVVQRVHGSNCPYCSNRKVLAGYNDLATTNPDVAAQWHPTKNADLKASDVTIKSGKKVWWICDRGHEWEAFIHNRSRGSNCPICANQQVLVGYNDLSTTHPNVSSEWHPTKNGELKPTDVTYGSATKIWWMGQCGHEWQAFISSRTSDACGCPICAGRQVLIGFNDLSSKYPAVAQEWHPTKNHLHPCNIMYGSGKKVWWICKHGHEWMETVHNRTRKAFGCPTCSGHRIAFGFNDLTTSHPDISSEWHPVLNGQLTPQTINAKSNRKVWWLCKYGHEYQSTIASRTGNNCGCPYCSGHKVLIGFNDLRSQCPSLAMEWHPTKNGNLKPTDVTMGSGKKVWWKCDKGHEWKSIISSRIGKNGCPYCSGRLAIPGETDLLTTHPTIIKEWDYKLNQQLKPTDITYGSKKKVWWKCDKGHSYQAQIRNRVFNNHACPICSNHQILVGFNDLATTHPHIAKQWHPTKNGTLKPTDVTSGSDKKAWWICENGHEWETLISSKTTRGYNCPCCHISNGERTIKQYLANKDLKFIMQNTFKNRTSIKNKLLRDDFAILNANDQVIATIEYHGEQHYRPVDFAGKGERWAKEQFKLNQLRDIAKTKYLNEHNIPQLIIPYWDFDNIPTLVENFLSTL